MGQTSPLKSQKPVVQSRCPVCGAQSDPAVRPFCSTRCADVDLSRWLRGAYAIPGGQQDADEDGDETQVTQRSQAAEPERDDEST